ncbi:interleukin-10 receptor subunit beta-like isoform X1 [Periophthalmus magnuspinnatus]|uniref:interleukin-10 receptor subunit beta-like isoform X1 n=1 Tax=Periophthalmus magnuspinnatus TaxID=409849 RepID=UPI00145B6B95|nr:interleukin-10 receptor subunit beta-like isoform X1 [Periophthalmus magnuspinnatus]
MSPLCCCFIVSVCVTALASGLPPPRNVRLTSHNMDLYLRWRPPENLSNQIFYSTKLQASFDSVLSRPACVNTSALFCELSEPGLKLTLLEFGQYNASVRALSGNEMSDWVYSQPLTMDKDTVIGPPMVALVPQGACLEVSVKDPEFRVSSMTNVFGLPQYNINYWPRRRAHQASHMQVRQNRVVLSGLEPWTEYCVQVQIHVDPARNQNSAEASKPVCESTADMPSPPWITAVVTFVALALTVAVVVITVIYHKQIFHFLCPKHSLPQPLQNLPECPHAPLFVPEEQCHPLTMIPWQDEGEHLTANS